ncbi:hypothetical protein L345_17199, partial [Ophiophagus hannah]
MRRERKGWSTFLPGASPPVDVSLSPLPCGEGPTSHRHCRTCSAAPRRRISRFPALHVACSSSCRFPVGKKSSPRRNLLKGNASINQRLSDSVPLEFLRIPQCLSSALRAADVCFQLLRVLFPGSKAAGPFSQHRRGDTEGSERGGEHPGSKRRGGGGEREEEEVEESERGKGRGRER